LLDDKQSLAAEPGCHRDKPRRGGADEMAIHRFSRHRSELGSTYTFHAFSGLAFSIAHRQQFFPQQPQPC